MPSFPGAVQHLHGQTDFSANPPDEEGSVGGFAHGRSSDRDDRERARALGELAKILEDTDRPLDRRGPQPMAGAHLADQAQGKPFAGQDLEDSPAADVEEHDAPGVGSDVHNRDRAFTPVIGGGHLVFARQAGTCRRFGLSCLFGPIQVHKKPPGTRGGLIGPAGDLFRKASWRFSLCAATGESPTGPPISRIVGAGCPRPFMGTPFPAGAFCSRRP